MELKLWFLFGSALVDTIGLVGGFTKQLSRAFRGKQLFYHNFLSPQIFETENYQQRSLRLRLRLLYTCEPARKLGLRKLLRLWQEKNVENFRLRKMSNAFCYSLVWIPNALLFTCGETTAIHYLFSLQDGRCELLSANPR